MAAALEIIRLWRDTPSTEVARNGMRLAGISSRSTLDAQARAAETLVAARRSKVERHTAQLTTDRAESAVELCSAPQLGHPMSLTPVSRSCAGRAAAARAKAPGGRLTAVP